MGKAKEEGNGKAPPPAAGGGPTGAAGTWSGSWQRTKPVPGSGEMELTVPDGGAGSIRLAGSACLAEKTPATATVDGANVTIAVDGNGAKATFTGTMSGKEMSGTMKVTCAAGTGEGNWKASKP
jgi:hypothetical protein